MRGLLLLAVVFVGASPVRAETCAGLLKHSRAGVSVSSAKVVPSGGFQGSEGSSRGAELPAFCRVVATLKPTADSDIGVEVWLPVAGWNGKYLAVGSGGWGGSIAYDGLADGLQRGYATSATDDGHRGSSASFLVGHPEKFVDFAYRAEHEMTVEAKALVQAFYGREARLSYWDGCSGGGREGLLQAFRYPEEFDGVIAGDPANMGRNAWALWLAGAALKEPAANIPAEKFSVIHRAVLDACDGLDGVKDGLIENPEACHPDFKVLTCKGADGPDCLTARQVETATTMLKPATTASGKAVFPGLEPGTELRWGRLIGGPGPADLFVDEFRYAVYQDVGWDWRGFDLERDGAKADAVNRGVDAMDPHLAAFAQRGGKLLLYHGWADQQVPPGSSTGFYKDVVEASGGAAEASTWVRLFMVPGMGHCSGGEGPDRFDKIRVMEDWVERGQAPMQIVAAHEKAGRVDRTRPLCAYPGVARYNGKGSIDDAGSFSCAAVSDDR